jgi:hypothetical protein
MAILTLTTIARAALATLFENSMMLSLVSRDWENEFAPGKGATVRVRKPTLFVADEFDGTINEQSVTETYVDVTLGHHADVSVALTSREMTLELTDIQTQVLTPALEAICKKIDQDLLALRDDVTNVAGDGSWKPTGVTRDAYDLYDPKAMLDAGVRLAAAKVPLSNRIIVVDATTAGEWLGNTLFSNNPAAVGTDVATEALLNASLGQRRYGFAPYQADNITDGLGVAFHKTAFTLATRPLELPDGVPADSKAIVNYKGVGIRVVKAYNISTKKTIISFDILYGCKTMAADRACLIGVSSDSSGS